MQATIANILQTPRYSFWIFLAGFIAFRGWFFFVLFGLAIWILEARHQDISECRIKEIYGVSHRSFFQGLAVIFLITPVVLYLLFMFAVPI